MTGIGAIKTEKIFLAVSNDLVMDQRVHRTAMTLLDTGMTPFLVGRMLPGSLEPDERPYEVKRLRIWFRKGLLFYACFNARLFLFLLFRRIRLLVSNDLDTLPACFVVSRLKGVPLVYDSHEYFTEVPELMGRRFARGTWRWLERQLLTRIHHGITVSTQIAEEYKKQYGISMAVVRNLPLRQQGRPRRPDLLKCDPQPVILYQGTLNEGRGLELMIRAMQYLEPYQFQVFGTGPLEGRLVALRDQLKLGERVLFMGQVPFDQMKTFTGQASLGISLEEDKGLNYRYALPNKLFDYIQAKVPVIVSDLPGMRSVVDTYRIGEVLSGREPAKLAEQVRRMMSDQDLRKVWKKNLSQAARELCWENEVEKLRNVFREAGLVFF